MKVIVFHGPDNASKHELLSWLRGPDVGADARTVGEMPPDSSGSVDERVNAAIDWADKAIALVTPDERALCGAPNVIDEIGRWRGRGREADLAIVRDQSCADMWSNLHGVVRVEYSARVNETFLRLNRFLGAPARGHPLRADPEAQRQRLALQEIVGGLDPKVLAAMNAAASPSDISALRAEMSEYHVRLDELSALFVTEPEIEAAIRALGQSGGAAVSVSPNVGVQLFEMREKAMNVVREALRSRSN